jgi:formylmethanofuran dehydrogenase subunit D
MRSLGVDGVSKVGDRGLPVVVYVDTHVSPADEVVHPLTTQTGMPKVKDEDRLALIEALKGLTNIAEVHITKLSAMTKAEQVELMGRAEVSWHHREEAGYAGWHAQIVVGLHTLDMYSALWMPATNRSAIIELFEEDGFDRESGSAKPLLLPLARPADTPGSFELLATSLNHNYIAIQNDKVLKEEAWRAHGSKRGDNFKVGSVTCFSRHRSKIEK